MKTLKWRSESFKKWINKIKLEEIGNWRPYLAFIIFKLSFQAHVQALDERCIKVSDKRLTYFFGELKMWPWLFARRCST